LGIDIGGAKGDIKLTAEGPKIGELAARLSGGYMSGFTYPLATGMDLMSAAIRISMGQDPGDLRPRLNRVAAERAIIPAPGRVTRIDGLEKARALPGVDKIFTMYQVGEIYRAPTCNMGKFGNFIAVADTRREVLSLCGRVQKTIKIKTEDPTYSKNLLTAKSA
jgi:biotin carboxylase